MIHNRLYNAAFCILLAVGGFGPSTTPAFAAEIAATPAVAAPIPFLVHINGIGGQRSIDRMLVSGLEQGGFRAEQQFFDWTDGEIGLVALQGYEKHKVQARKLADLILEQWKADPKRPLYITAHSGGAGIAAFALELLPDEVKVERVVFFAPALSPGYDLSKALRRVSTQLVVFSSPLDAVVLSTGTKLFGTIDGVRGDAAGFKGFVRPDKCDDPTQYAKLLARPYQRTWFGKYGNAGSHICAMRPRFARDYVAPILLTGALPEEHEAEMVSAAPTTRPARSLAH